MPPAPMLQPAPTPRESVERLDAERARVHVTVSCRFLEKLEAAKNALGHACPGGSAEEILERGLDLVLAGTRSAKVSSRSLGRAAPRRAATPSPPR